MPAQPPEQVCQVCRKTVDELWRKWKGLSDEEKMNPKNKFDHKYIIDNTTFGMIHITCADVALSEMNSALVPRRAVLEMEQAREAQEEARRRAQEEARRRAQEEARRRAQEEARRRAQEEEARRRAQEEAARRKAQEQKKLDEAVRSCECFKSLVEDINVIRAISNSSAESMNQLRAELKQNADSFAQSTQGMKNELAEELRLVRAELFTKQESLERQFLEQLQEERKATSAAQEQLRHELEEERKIALAAQQQLGTQLNHTIGLIHQARAFHSRLLPLVQPAFAVGDPVRLSLVLRDITGHRACVMPGDLAAIAIVVEGEQQQQQPEIVSVEEQAGPDGSNVVVTARFHRSGTHRMFATLGGEKLMNGGVDAAAVELEIVSKPCASTSTVSIHGGISADTNDTLATTIVAGSEFSISIEVRDEFGNPTSAPAAEA